MKNYKIGDIVLVKSVAGECIPKVHVKLKERITVKPTKGKRVGLRMSMDWPGYSGWEAELVYQEEIDMLRKEWSIPFTKPGEETFVFDSCIVRKSKRDNSIRRKNTKLRKKSKK